MDTVAFYAQWVTLALILAVPFAVSGHKPNFWAAAGVCMYVVSYFIANSFHIAYWILEPPEAYGFALRIYTAHGMLLAVMYTAIVFCALTIERLPRADLQAKLVWLILLLAEGFAVLEYMGCKMLTDPFGSQDLLLSQVWGIETSRFACGRALSALSPFIAPIITTLFVLWVILTARRVNARISRS